MKKTKQRTGKMQQKPSKAKKKNNYFTIMLLYNPERKPIQIRISWLAIKACAGLCLLLLVFAGYSFISAALLRPVVAEKKNLEAEVSQLKTEKEQIVSENLNLRQHNLQQGEELQELEEISNLTMQEMEKLNRREEEIRGKLGMESQEGEASPSNADPKEEGVISTALNQNTLYSGGDAAFVRATLLGVRGDISRKLEAYDSYEETIESEEYKKEQKEKAAKELRQGMVAYAMQFLGNRYAYGQNDPHTGVDCSGFTRYILANYAGIYLNRTAASQSAQGSSVSIDKAKPGDLLFYGNGRAINHVALYIGEGQVIHASNERNGIIVSSWNYRTPVAIRNVIGE
ncbi:MAG: C40 family peptidase [Johnsonella sp.]|nr:C40 family peptidase [Johnsonella sp.]